MKRTISPSSCMLVLIASLLSLLTCNAKAQGVPPPPGKMVDLGGHSLHVYCTGKGHPTVVVENGLGDFSFDWILVQTTVSKFTRICTYDRAGYAWSDPGPMPRTFAQLNLELRDALSKLGEQGPFVLVGHSFGGPVVRNFATTYPRNVAGMVLVDAATENQRYVYKGKAILLRSGAEGKVPPPPHEIRSESDKQTTDSEPPREPARSLDPLYDPLPPEQKDWQRWAEVQLALKRAENSQRDWSPEYLLKMHDIAQSGVLGAIPLIVLTRANGGFDKNLDFPAEQLEKERLEGQARLALLSTNSRQFIVDSGHNMDLEAPDVVAAAIFRILQAIRSHSRLKADPLPIQRH